MAAQAVTIQPSGPPPLIQAPSPQPESTASGKTLLLVEDDVFSAQPLRILLTRQGWTVHAVTTIAEAQRFLDTQTPDSIILDLMLPDGEGSVILDRIRRTGLATKVTVTTASTDRDRLKQVRALRPDAMLTKPLDFSELLRVV